MDANTGVNNSSKKGSGAYKRSVVYVILGLIVSIVMIVAFSNGITTISANMAYEVAMTVKKNMLQETVDNMTVFLDEYRQNYMDQYPDATPEEVEQAMYETVRGWIYTQQFKDGSYMWVNKILNYDGGDDYAIRLIHPNLTETEGSYLTTNEVNPMGNKPYEEELNGVKKNGFVFLTYKFKKLDSDEVSEKVTYSKLYKELDWILCMGVNLDDLEHYEEQARSSIRLYKTIVLIIMAITWLLLLFVVTILYRDARLTVYEVKNQELRNKLNWDNLTGANSREYGEKQLVKEMTAFRSGKENTLVMMMDVDHFKTINDTYGHEKGDEVLKTVVSAVRGCIRPSDILIRWGGDEFLAIFQTIPLEFQAEVADKILNAVHTVSIPGLKDEDKVSVSMGFSYFEESDFDEKTVLSRADAALYLAKAAGRNNWKIINRQDQA